MIPLRLVLRGIGAERGAGSLNCGDLSPLFLANFGPRDRKRRQVATLQRACNIIPYPYPAGAGAGAGGAAGAGAAAGGGGVGISVLPGPSSGRTFCCIGSTSGGGGQQHRSSVSRARRRTLGELSLKQRFFSLMPPATSISRLRSAGVQQLLCPQHWQGRPAILQRLSTAAKRTDSVQSSSAVRNAFSISG